MKDSICCYINESCIDEFECDVDAFCNHDNCVDCDSYKVCEFCSNEPFCISRHGVNQIEEN